MSKSLKINFISDVACPWCAVGWHALRQALERVGDDVEVNVEFEPFELNPNMPAEGQNIVEHIGEKYGSTPEQSAQSREQIRKRAAEVGFEFNMSDESRIYNTFDAHRLLHWAHLQGRQHELKERLLAAYQSEGRDPSDYDTLVDMAGEVGLDVDEARKVLETGAYGHEVRQREDHWISRGVSGVPTIVFNEERAMVGAHTPEDYEAAIRELTA
jgi:predicted DsbA family dithiol-disulfide isomerase